MDKTKQTERSTCVRALVTKIKVPPVSQKNVKKITFSMNTHQIFKRD